jgi:hypothetical protein
MSQTTSAPSRPTPRARLAVERLESRNLPSFSNVLVNDPAADLTFRDTQSETALVLGAGGTVVAAFVDTGSAVLPAPQGFSGWATSADGGASFTDRGKLPRGAAGFGSDPFLARSDSTGTIFLSTASFRRGFINVYRSVDNGASLLDPVNGTPGLDPNVDSTDRNPLAVDNFPGPGQGNVYLATQDLSNAFTVPNPDPSHNAILLTRSTDDGLTWGPDGGTRIVVAEPTSSGFPRTEVPYVTVGPDHAVYVFWWDATKHSAIMMEKSTDQGLTFGPPVEVAKLNTHNFGGELGLTDDIGREFRTPVLAQAVVNPITGDIYVAYHDRANGSADRGDILFVQSTDGGATWSKPVTINDDTTKNGQWMPALALTPDGSRLGVFWYDRRLDPANDLIDRFGAIGTVSGHAVTFGTNFRVTDVSFPPAFGQGDIDPNYMGDYDQAVADDDFFYTTWGDNRLGDAFHANQPDVRLAKVPVTFGPAAAAPRAAALPAGTAPTPPGAAAGRTIAPPPSADFGAALPTGVAAPPGPGPAAAADPGALLAASWAPPAPAPLAPGPAAGVTGPAQAPLPGQAGLDWLFAQQGHRPPWLTAARAWKRPDAGHEGLWPEAPLLPALPES